MGFVIEKSAYDPLPTGEYRAVVADVTQEDGRFGPQVRFHFELTDGEHKGRRLSAWAGATYSPKSKLFAWTRSILGQAPERFESDTLIGKPCRLAVVRRTGEDGVVHNRVDDVLPARF